MVRIYDFRQKEVININDGKRLGYVFDAVIDEETGKVNALIIPGKGKVMEILSGVRCTNSKIPWKKIKKIGDDIVLVEIGGISDEE